VARGIGGKRRERARENWSRGEQGSGKLEPRWKGKEEKNEGRGEREEEEEEEEKSASSSLSSSLRRRPSGCNTRPRSYAMPVGHYLA